MLLPTIGALSPAEERDFSSNLLCPDRLWGPPSLLYNGYRGSFHPGIKRGRGVTLTTHPHVVPRSRMSRSYIPFTLWRLYGGCLTVLILLSIYMVCNDMYQTIRPLINFQRRKTDKKCKPLPSFPAVTLLAFCHCAVN
jgi:hypothetical protein